MRGFVLLTVALLAGCTATDAASPAGQAGDDAGGHDAHSAGDTAPEPPDTGDAGPVADLLPGPDVAAPAPDAAGDAPVVDLSEPTDIGPDTAGPPDTLPPEDVAGDAPETGELPEPPPVPEHPPDQLGPHPVGVRAVDFFDLGSARLLKTAIWYPAVKAAEPKVDYFDMVLGFLPLGGVMPGEALDEPSAAKAGAPYPVVLFSHGFNGINFQSFAITEYLASHGYVVIAPDHAGNTFKESWASDEVVAQVAIARPKDLAFVFAEAQKLAAEGGSWLEGMLDPTRVAVMGHSFGGWTALLVAGGVADADHGKAECAAGTKADVFCPYIVHWPSGAKIGLADPPAGLLAAVYLAPGGSASFAEGGLDGVGVPGLLFGGTLDNMTPLDTEIGPIHDALPDPVLRVVIEKASHMSFTNICDIPIVSTVAMAEYCAVEGVLEPAKAHHMTRTLVTAFLGLHVKEEAGMAQWLEPAFAAEKLPGVAID